MPADLSVVAAAAIAFAAVLVTTPLAIRVACRTGFHDHPGGYKAHAAATPYLGGTAVLLGVVLSASLFGEAFTRFAPVLIGTLVLWLVGTIDDRRTLSPLIRVVAAVGAAIFLWAEGLGWSFFTSPAENLVLTALWTLGLVNAFNLMDNMDGASSTVASVSAFGAGVLALMAGDTALAALAFSLCGALIAFLRFNAASSGARIFLGDGGSMPIGFLVAALVMAAPMGDVREWPVLLAGSMLVGLPILDTALVIVSRLRRGVPVWTGGRDHLTHRLRSKLPSARAVAAGLGAVQGGLAAVTIMVTQVGEVWIVLAGGAGLLLGVLAVAILEMPGLAPAPHRATSSR